MDISGIGIVKVMSSGGHWTFVGFVFVFSFRFIFMSTFVANKDIKISLRLSSYVILIYTFSSISIEHLGVCC